MGLIEVNGIRVFAYHGCLQEEGRIGGHYEVDICAEADLSDSEASDKLTETIDYSRFTEIVREQMAIRANLIEHVARRIIDTLKAEWSANIQWKMKVKKEHPPVHGHVDHVAYTLKA